MFGDVLNIAIIIFKYFNIIYTHYEFMHTYIHLIKLTVIPKPKIAAPVWSKMTVPM